MSEIKLTPEQQQVVDSRGGHLLVSAAAGSGKTKVLVDRVLKYVEEGHNIDEFLLITYTQAAAAEMRGKMVARISDSLAKNPEQAHLQQQLNRVYMAQISTVHSFCGTILREFAHELDLPMDFRTADDVETAILRDKAMKTILDEAYQNMDDPQIAAVIDMLGAGRDDQNLPSLVIKIYNSVHCWPDPKARIEELRKTIALTNCTEPTETLWGKYMFDVFKDSLKNYEKTYARLSRMLEDASDLAPLQDIFDADIAYLQSLGRTETWDELACHGCKFSTWKSVKKPSDPELQLDIKNRRTKIKERVTAAYQSFQIPADEVLQDLRSTSAALGGLLTLVERFTARYTQEKRSHRILDYTDLEHEALRLLIRKDGTPTKAAETIAKRYEQIMVDEYQDSNAVLDAIFTTLANKNNLFMVGDVKQSIYRFRMADPRCFLKRYESYVDYKKALDGEPRKILLSNNFRSYPEVLQASNDMFRLLMSKRVGGLVYGEAESLKTEKEPHGGEAIELHCIDTKELPEDLHCSKEEVEAEFVARRIRKMLDDGEEIRVGDDTKKIEADDIAILLRATKGNAEYYIRALKRYGIESVCGNEDIFNCEEITVLLNILRVIDNPHHDIPLLSALLSPIFRFTADEVAQFRSKQRCGPIIDAMKTTERGRAFLPMLATLRSLSQQNDLQSLLNEIDERLYFRATYPNCTQNFEKLLGIAKSYEDSGRYGLSGFLKYLDLQKEKGVSTELIEKIGAVRIMTMHKSKGLEFPVVFLSGLAKQFSKKDFESNVLVDSELGLASKFVDAKSETIYDTIAFKALKDRLKKENRSEEMRIMYVAMTRAKCRLIMTMCGKTLKQYLKTIAEEMTLPVQEDFVGDVMCPGQWVLMCAMTRTEAGELFQAGGYPIESSVSLYPWKIKYHEGSLFVPSEQAQEAERCTQGVLKLCVPQYAYTNACRTPAKLTATQLKGRTADEELDGMPMLMSQLRFDKPKFETEKTLNAAQRGSALHLVMEHLRYDRTNSAEEVRTEIDRMLSEHRILPEQAEAVQPAQIAAFFQSELGKRIKNASELVREFKFTVMENAAIYDADLSGEQIMLQGVADCCIIEEDGLVVIDFKTDEIKTGEESHRAERYRKQLEAYSRALSRIFEKPVKERILYFFSTQTEQKL